MRPLSTGVDLHAAGEASKIETELITALQLELQSLQTRVKELESENAHLLAQISNCRCQKVYCKKKEDIIGLDGLKLDGPHATKDSKEIIPGVGSRVHKFHKRFVALKVMYFGQRFFGFAAEAQMDPTVESEIFKALKKTRLIDEGDKKELLYSRCGRTDRGVSSVGQVIALLLRSKQVEGRVSSKTSGEELDYVQILNKVLPNDIRVMGWSPAPVDFSARFSCLRRKYKYFFWKDDLDILAMEKAANKFVGQHDFRNFCKMDAKNVHNYRRHITLFEIAPCHESFGDDELWVMEIKGTAFLWHQIRCMAALLFLIGEGLESPDIIDLLLDTKSTTRKPQYKMAPEIPLVLQSCEFEGLRFICSAAAKRALCQHLKQECRSYKLQAAIFTEALQSCSIIEIEDPSSTEERLKRRGSVHVSISARPTEPSYEERRAKLTCAGGTER